jgi:hypothetical protein
MSDTVLIHVRFAPDAGVREIGERPEALTPQAWFNRLTVKAGDAYQAFSGGRGVFRLSPERIAAIAAEPVE